MKVYNSLYISNQKFLDGFLWDCCDLWRIQKTKCSSSNSGTEVKIFFTKMF